MTAVSAPVSPRVARYSSESGKHKPCKGKEPFVAVFAPFVPKSAGGTKISRRKQGNPSQDTADGNADRIRLCRACGGDNKNGDLGVARIKTSQV